MEMNGFRTEHQINSVGVGDYYVAFGDSITDGDNDDISSDDISLDLRNAGGGYEPILNDLLTATEDYPHTVINEGVGGEESYNGLARIQDVINIHPEANYFLILFGTNDSGGTLPVPSGLGLNPGDSGYIGSYKDNMQQIIDEIMTAGKTPILGKVPITLGACPSCDPFPDPDVASRNLLIQEYNLVIGELVSANGIAVIPPDFYNYFRANQDEMSDNLHPNGTGYISMANLWFNALTD
jgi:lysophospholipase L1-like esterase